MGLATHVLTLELSTFAGALMQRDRLSSILVVLGLVLATAVTTLACDHDSHSSVWDKEVEAHGRSRTLLSFKNRK